jgi:hypothetical protein
MAGRRELAVEVVAMRGWNRGYITMPVDGRLVEYLDTKPDMIALARAVLAKGVSQPFVRINTEQVTGVRADQNKPSRPDAGRLTGSAGRRAPLAGTCQVSA